MPGKREKRSKRRKPTLQPRRGMKKKKSRVEPSERELQRTYGEKVFCWKGKEKKKSKLVSLVTEAWNMGRWRAVLGRVRRVRFWPLSSSISPFVVTWRLPVAEVDLLSAVYKGRLLWYVLISLLNEYYRFLSGLKRLVSSSNSLVIVVYTYKYFALVNKFFIYQNYRRHLLPFK